MFLFGFEQGSGSIAVRGGWNVKIGPLGDLQGRWDESENPVLVVLAFHGPSFPRPTSGPSTLTRTSLANFDRRFYPRQTAKNPKKARDLNYEKDPEPITPASTGVAIPRSSALIIGVVDYKHLPSSAKLEFADRDAESIYSILISPEGGNFRAENVRKLSGARATLANLQKEIDGWLPSFAKADDRVLVYFAGHGFVDPKTGRAHLAPYDLDPKNIAGTGDSMEQLGLVIGSKVQAKWKVLLTDSCHSGAISPEHGEVVNKSLLGLNRSMFSMTASRARERSFESKDWGGGHGIFTYYVVRGLEGYADESKDGIVTADELAEYVRTNVREATKSQQNPTSD